MDKLLEKILNKGTLYLRQNYQLLIMELNKQLMRLFVTEKAQCMNYDKIFRLS